MNAWIIKIRNFNHSGSLKSYPYILSLATTSSFQSFVNLMEDINILVSPELCNETAIAIPKLSVFLL